MVNFKELKVGDKMIFSVKDPDGNFIVDGFVNDVTIDHALMEDKFGFHYWIDSDTEYQFEKVR